MMRTAKRGQHEDRLQRVSAREEEPDEHDRPELADAPERHRVPAERRAEHPGVTKDRQQGAERGRGEGQRDDDLAALAAAQVDRRSRRGRPGRPTAPS